MLVHLTLSGVVSLDGASGAWLKTATLSCSSSPSVCWSVLATYIWVVEYQDLLLDAFSNAAALTVVPCFVAGHFGLGLCCFLLMIKAMYIFYKKLLSLSSKRFPRRMSFNSMVFELGSCCCCSNLASVGCLSSLAGNMGLSGWCAYQEHG